MTKWSPLVFCWVAGMATVASIIGIAAWVSKSISRAVRWDNR